MLRRLGKNVSVVVGNMVALVERRFRWMLAFFVMQMQEQGPSITVTFGYEILS